MNSNQSWKPDMTNFWNPIALSTVIQKSPSYESLTDEEKLHKRIQKIERIVEHCNNIKSVMINNEQKFNNRMKELSDNSPNFMKEFYEESPHYRAENMFDVMIWLSHSEKEKNDILDRELEEYFM